MPRFLARAGAHDHDMRQRQGGERPLAARACESTRIYRAAAAALRSPPRALEKGEVPRKGGA